MAVEQIIRNIVQNWFYTEPLLFAVCTSHHLVENNQMNCVMRSGQQRIEYNSDQLKSMNDTQIEEYLKIESFRILLSHPYSRKPYNARGTILLLASDVVINSFYKAGVPLAGVEYLKSLTPRFKQMENPLGEKWAGTEEEAFFMRNLNINRNSGAFESVDNLDFESWYHRLFFLIKEISSKGQNAGAFNLADVSAAADNATELWEENSEQAEQIKSQIQKAEIDQGWGSIGGGLEREIQSQCDFSMDYRRMLSQFRQSIITANRTLTRMKPSRRFGFKAMGSRYNRKANVLIAVDVSGSITDESFNRFFHVINNIFFLGIIEKIDVIFFDTNLKLSKPIPFKKKIELDSIKGRGGTNFQPAIDFFAENKDYNGLIIFTDGQGSIPAVSKSQNILWILTSRLDYEKSRSWIQTLPGSKSTYMPF